MLQRNLLYTGVTRGKRLVVLVGRKKAIAIAVRNVSGRRRWSKLDAGWLAAGKLKSREDIVAGFPTFPETLLKLFADENLGKLVLQVADV